MLDDAAIAGWNIRFRKGKTLWMDLLPAWEQRDAEKFGLSRNPVIDIDPAFPVARSPPRRLWR